MDALTASLALLRLEGLGPATFWQLIESLGSAEAALQQPLEHFPAKLSARARAQVSEYQRIGVSGELGQWALAERARCAEQCIHLLSWEDAVYPSLLREIQRPPPLLYVSGNPEVLSLPQVAVVGARRASRGGLDNATAFAADLASAGFVITSGLALGVDAAAHRGALKQRGTTIAVLGTGVDHIYPPRNAGLAEQILLEGGAIVSEMPLGTAPEPANFPRRNRIISGLSLGVLLVEAAVRSGSLITARLALEQNREVFAIPGSIHNPLARGCHQMLKQGAALVETSSDIVDQLGGALAGLAPQTGVAPNAHGGADATQPLALSAAQLRLAQALGSDPRTLEQLAQDTGDEAGNLLASLLQLELEDLVEQLPGGYQLTPRGERALTSAG